MNGTISNASTNSNDLQNWTRRIKLRVENIETEMNVDEKRVEVYDPIKLSWLQGEETQSSIQMLVDFFLVQSSLVDFDQCRKRQKKNI